MNLEPKLWGPSFWTTLHYISASYDINPNPNIRSTMKNFIHSLPVFLPCKECQDHAFDFIKSSDLDKVVQNRKELFLFFFNFHNTVNNRLNKPPMSIHDAVVKYHIPPEEYGLVEADLGYLRSSQFRQKHISFIVLFIVLTIIVLLFVICFVGKKRN